MSQPAFEIVNSILDIWKIAVQAIMFLVLWAAAFREKKSKRDGIAAVLFILANIGIGFLPCAAWVRYGVSAFVIMGYAGICYKKQIGKAVFVMLAFYNLHCLSFLIANSIYMKITGVMMKSLDAMQESYMQQVYQCLSVGMAVSALFYMVLYVAMAVIFHSLIKGEAVMAWQDIILLSILNFVGSMIANVVNGLLIVRINTDAFVLFDEKPDLLWKIPMIAVLIFAGEAALIYFWQRYRILLAGEYGEIEEYVRRMDETMQELEYKYVTGNAVTDVIINDKCRRAEKAGIRFDADFRYGGEIPVFDMGIILNNLLDNAIEACEKLEPGKGFIRLSLKRKKQFLILYVENSFDGAVPVSKGSSLPPTTKQSILPGIITEHGIGLENVRDIAERYFGGVNIKVKGDVFHVTVMLQQGEVGEGK